MKWGNFAIKSALAVLILGVGSYELGYLRLARLNARLDELESEKQRLEDFVGRLRSSRRVGQLDVVKQYRDMLGRTVSVLLWQEIAEDGTLARPYALEVIGNQVYVEGKVIKFDHARLEESSGREGESLVLFHRIFADQQPPMTGVELDRQMPPQGVTTTLNAEEAKLWERFWELTTNPELAKEHGVRVAQCEAPSVRVAPGQVWEVSLDAAGGLNLRYLGARPAEAPGKAAP
ncbi:MAG: hypothetical protein BroJett003_23680 [Planctomycetota bacterium]|nr:MAG: hypothetical protein BroJett003_23680 [Planctomycetota bacterium]